MANRILIELDTAEARVVFSRGTARVQDIADSFSVEFPAGSSPGEITELIRSGLNRRSIPMRGDLDLIFSRRDIELREIDLPPCPDNELPEMVRFAARNEFTHLGETTQLDFVPIQGDENSPRKILAATLNPAPTVLAEELASGLKMRLRRTLLRPWCLAHSLPDDAAGDQPRLILDAAGESIEMTLWQDGHLLLTRSFRPGSHEPDTLQNEIADEVQRTLIAAVRSTGGKAVGQIAILGNPETLPLPERKIFPPVAYVYPASLRSGTSPGPARALVFAAHRGALNRLENGTGDMLDFRNPRRVKGKQTDWKRIAIWGGAAALLLIGSVFFAWSALSSQASKIASLQDQLATLTKANESTGNRPGVKQIVGEVELVDRWVAGSVDWTVELQEISDRMLTPDDAIVNLIQMSIEKDKARVRLEGHLVNTETGTDIKTRLTQRPYDFGVPGATREDRKMDDYPFTFDYNMTRPIDAEAALADISEKARTAKPDNESDDRSIRDSAPAGTGSTSSESTE